MCLAIPAKILKINGSMAQVDMMGNEREISTVLVPEIQIGEYVLVHAGFAISIIDEENAKETEELLLEVANAYEEE